MKATNIHEDPALGVLSSFVMLEASMHEIINQNTYLIVIDERKDKILIKNRNEEYTLYTA